MAADLGRAFVSIIPKADGISNQISNIIAPATKTAGDKGGASLSRGLANGINSVGSVVTKFAATSAATIAGFAGSISSKAFGGGFARAMQIDDATAKMTQLGMKTEKVMSSVNDSVTGTRYGLNEMAGVAVNLSSAGVKAGNGLTSSLKSVASVASIAGVDLNHMGAIYTKVASTGKLTGQVMSQLQMNGINANAALQKSLGKSQEEISKMVSSGEIDFKTFSDAMYKYFGDAALSANSTFSGAMANVGAALSRIGAKFADPVMGKLREVFAGTNAEVKGGLILALDNLSKALQPVIDKFTEFVGVVGDKVVGAINTFNDVMGKGGSLADGFKAAVADLLPDSLVEKFNALSPAAQSLLGGLGKIGAVVAGVAGGMGLLSGAVGSLVPGIGGLLSPLMGAGGAFGLVSKTGNALFSTISSLIGGGGLSGLPGPLSAIAGPAGAVVAVFAAMFAKSEAFRSAVIGLIQTVASSLMPVLRSIVPVIQQVMSAAMQIVTMVADSIAPVIQQITPMIGQIITTVGSLVSSIMSALMPAINAIIPVVQNILSVVVPIVQTIATTVISIVQRIITTVGPIIKRIVQIVGPVLKTVFTIVSTILNAIKNVFSKIWGAIGPIVTRAVNIIKSVIGGISSVVSKVANIFNRVKEAIQKPIETVRDKVKGIIEKIKGFFHFKIKPPHIPKPHFGITPKGWKVGDLLKGKIPHLSIDWRAKGGIADGATLIGAGEAGQEAILPLDPFWSKMDNWGSKIVNTLAASGDRSDDGEVSRPIVVSIQMGAVEVARALAQPMQNELNRMEVRENRKLGYI